MKVIISIFLLLSLLYAGVEIYKSDSEMPTLLGFETTDDDKIKTITLYGGMVDLGPATPAICDVKYRLEQDKDNFLGTIIPFVLDPSDFSEEKKAKFEPDIDKKNHIKYIYAIIQYVIGCPLQSQFSDRYDQVTQESEYQTSFKELIKLNHQNAQREFRRGNIDMAIKILEPYISEALNRGYYFEDIFNDYGFFLQQNKNYQEALKYLNIVKEKSPQRVIVYMNLGDLYWDMGDEFTSHQYYKHYVELMKNTGIPQTFIIRLDF